MGGAAAELAGGGGGGAVGADRAPRLLQGQIHVLFGVVGVNRGDGAAFLDEQIEEHVERIGLGIKIPGAEVDDAVHRLAFVLRPAADEHAAPIAADGGV